MSGKSLVIVIFMILSVLTASSVFASSFNVVSDTSTLVLTESPDIYGSTAVLADVHPSWPNIPGAKWIWTTQEPTADEALNGGEQDFRTYFDIPECAQNASIFIQVAADDAFVFKFNTVEDEEAADWHTVYDYTFTDDDLDQNQYFNRGTNFFEFVVANYPGNSTDPAQNPAGLIYKAKVTYQCPGQQVPEFGPTAVLLALSGAAVVFIFMRRKGF